MKAVAYSIKPFEKEPLSKANQKKHDITLISNSLNIETASYAEGKDAVLVFTNDDLSAPVINHLADMGVKYIAARSTGTDHIDKEAASKRGLKIANVPAYSPQAIAEQTVALALALSRKLISGASQAKHFDFRLDSQVGFNFYGKTVGIIGMGNIGRATAAIFRGLGCRVLGHDEVYPAKPEGFEPSTLQDIFRQSDVVSLHVPLTPDTHYLINRKSLSGMKNGVMILNTARGSLINTNDLLPALESGKIGYLGLDVYEHEKGLFFDDHSKDPDKDLLLTNLMRYPNVLITGHQAFLTNEALNEIALKTISNLDKWEAKKCVGDACVCALDCKSDKSKKLK